MDEKFLRQNIIIACQRMHQLRAMLATDGNISLRLNEEQILITPSGLSKPGLQPEDIAKIALDGTVIEGNPSSEKWLHLEVYKRCDQAESVIHAHPPAAIAWTVAHPELKELPPGALSEVILAAGGIPIAPYTRPASKELATALAAYLPQYRAVILSRHGAITWGVSLEECVNGMERIEHAAYTLKLAHDLGGITELTSEEVAELTALRKKIGDKLL